MTAHDHSTAMAALDALWARATGRARLPGDAYLSVLAAMLGTGLLIEAPSRVTEGSPAMHDDNDLRRAHCQSALDERLSLLADMFSRRQSALRSFDPTDRGDAYHSLFGEFIAVDQLRRQVLEVAEQLQRGQSLDDIANALSAVDAKIKSRFPTARLLDEVPLGPEDCHGPEDPKGSH